MQTILRSSRYPMVISTGAASSVGRVGGHLHTPGGGRLGAISAPNTPDRARAPAGQRVTRQERGHGRRRTPRTGDPAPAGAAARRGAGRRFILSRKQPRVIHRMAMACTSDIACSDKRRRSYARHYARPGIHAHGLAARGWRTVTRQSTNGQPMSRCTLLSMHHLTKRCVGDHVPQRRRAFEQRRASTSATQVARLGSAQ